MEDDNMSKANKLEQLEVCYNASERYPYGTPNDIRSTEIDNTSEIASAREKAYQAFLKEHKILED